MTIVEFLTKQAAAHAEIETAVTELLMNGSLSPARRELLREFGDFIKSRRQDIETARAARIARLGAGAPIPGLDDPRPSAGKPRPSRNDGRQPSRYSDGRLPAKPR